MAKLRKKDEEPELYFVDLYTKVSAPFHPQADFSRISESVEQIDERGLHLWNRFNQKPLNLKGYGKIKNQMFMAEVEAEGEDGRRHKFYWNFGVAGRYPRDRFNGSIQLDNMRTKLISQYNDTIDELEKRYDDMIIMYKYGFKINKVILRVIVETKPKNRNKVRLLMGIRNAVFGSFKRSK